MILLILMMILYKKFAKNQSGITAAGFCLGYATARFLVEFIRLPDAHIGYLAWGWMTMGQVLTVPIAALGFVLLYCGIKN